MHLSAELIPYDGELGGTIKLHVEDTMSLAPTVYGILMAIIV